MPAIYREPLCPHRVLPCNGVASVGHVREHYPSFIAHTGSCAGPKSSRCLESPLHIGSLQVAASPCWKLALPDAISADPSVDAWLPTPVEPCAALARCFTQNFGLPPVMTRSASTSPVQWLQYGSYFVAASIPLCSGLYLCSPP